VAHRGNAAATSRRIFLKAVAGSGAALSIGSSFPAPAVGQGLRKLKYTNPWLPDGSAVYSYIAQANGHWRRRGLDVEVARGFGSIAAAQAVAAGQFDFGGAVTSSVLLQAAKGLPLTIVGQVEYLGTQGIGLLADSPIKTPKDLEGRTIGATPTSGEFPFLPAFAERAGFRYDSLKIVQFDNQVRERALATKQVDAISGIASTTIPQLVSKGIDVRYLLFANYGIKLYSTGIVTLNKTVRSDPDLVQALVDGIFEAEAWCINHPDEALDLYIRQIKELSLTADGREYARIGFALHRFFVLQDELKTHGFGWADPAAIKNQLDLVMEYIVKQDGLRPAIDDVHTNRFVGRIRLSDAEFDTAKNGVSEWQRYFR
jgi:NitT/TauT family transport system substrate-binding protein